MPLSIDPETGIPISPVREAMHALNVSVPDLAHRTRLAHSTVQYTTQCLFPNPNHQLTKIFSEVNPNFLEDYYRYQAHRRLYSSIPILLWEKGAPMDPDSGRIRLPESFPEVPEINPHIEFREFLLETTVDDYCEELCLERYLVHFMERKEPASFSNQLRLILVMAMGSTATDQLVQAYRTWRHDRE